MSGPGAGSLWGVTCEGDVRWSMGPEAGVCGPGEPSGSGLGSGWGLGVCMASLDLSRGTMPCNCFQGSLEARQGEARWVTA